MSYGSLNTQKGKTDSVFDNNDLKHTSDLLQERLEKPKKGDTGTHQGSVRR